MNQGRERGSSRQLQDPFRDQAVGGSQQGYHRGDGISHSSWIVRLCSTSAGELNGWRRGRREKQKDVEAVVVVEVVVVFRLSLATDV